MRNPGIAMALKTLPWLLAMALLVSIPSVASAQSSPPPPPSLCAAGTAVPDAANNPGLVADCDALLAARDTLAGTATLNWSASTAIGEWDGVTLGGSPQRVTTLDLRERQLTGTIPAQLGSLASSGHI